MKYCCKEFNDGIKSGMIKINNNTAEIIWKDSILFAYTWGSVTLRFCPFCGKKLN